MIILDEIKTNLQTALDNLNFNCQAHVDFSDRPDLAHFQSNVAFSLAKICKTSPFSIATKIKDEFLLICDKFEVFVAMPGFVNFSAKTNYLFDVLQKTANSDNLLTKSHSGKKILIDYGGANIAKPLHVGHMRPAFIGQALCNLARFCGCEVVGDVHLGDWGLQMGLVVLYYMQNYDCSPFFSNPNFNAEFINESTLNVAYPSASAKSKQDEDFKNLAREITAKIQSKENGYWHIYQQVWKVSLAMVGRVYDMLGVKFDLFLGESHAQPYVKNVVDAFEKSGLLKESGGAKIVEVSQPHDTAPVPPMLVKASSGADLYATTECATLFMREKDVDADEYWYVVDQRQNLHFLQVFRACKMAKIVSDHKKLEFLPFGTMNGLDGKPFKTRDGGLAKLEEFVGGVCEKAAEKLLANGAKDENGLSLKIALAALKFGDLINYRSKDIVFDVDRMTSFEGKTGPYVQYTLVRIKSILSKCRARSFEFVIDKMSEQEKKLALCAVKMSWAVEQAFAEKAPNFVAQTLYELCGEFSTFYGATRVLAEEDEQKKNNYLLLLEQILKIATCAADILGIDVPDKM